MTDVFISYSRKDSDFVHHLFDALKATDRQAWVDWEDIPITSDWIQEIDRGIEAADDFLFIISPDSVTSTTCNHEIEHAMQHHKRLIPIMRREVPPEALHKALAQHNWLFCRPQDDFDNAFRQLIDVLNTDLYYVRAHTRLLIRAREWDDNQRDASYLLLGNDLLSAESWLAESGGKEPKPTEVQTQYILASRRATNTRQRTFLAGVSVALVVTVILAITALGLFGLAESRREESDQRGTAVAQQAATATNALGLSELRGTQVAQQAATVVAAEATSERRSDEWQSLAWAVSSSQALDADNTDLALALALQANAIPNPQAQAQAALVSAAYAPGTGMVYSGQHTSWIAAMDISPDGQWLLSGDYAGKLVLWNASTGKAVHSADLGTSAINSVTGVQASLGSPSAITFLPNATAPTALIGQSSGDLGLWDVNTWKETNKVDTGSYISSIAVSPDGSIAAVGSSTKSGNLALWDAHSLKLLRTLNGHTDFVGAVAFSADGKQLLSGSNDATVRLWDVATGSLIRTLSVTDPNNTDIIVIGVAFGLPLTDGTPTGIGATDSGQIIEWNLDTGAEIFHYDVGTSPASLSGIAISSDRKLLASAGLDGILYLWDTANGHLIRRYLGHTAGLMAVVFSADERTIYTASQDETLRRWYTVSGAEMRILRGPATGFGNMAISPDEKLAVTGGRAPDPTLLLWDLQTGKVIQRMSGHSDTVIAVAFSSDGKQILSGSFDGTLRLWDVATGQALKTYSNLGASIVSSVAFSADGKTALIGTISEGYATQGWGALVDLSTGTIIKKFDTGQGLATDAIFSPDGKQILIGGTDLNAKGVISLWDAQTGKQIRQFQQGQSGAISTVQFSSDGTKVLSSSQDFNSILWDVASGNQIRRFVGHSDIVTSAEFSPDEQTMISGSYDGTIRLWNVNTGSEILRFNLPTDTPRTVMFSKDGKTVYSASREGNLTQWEIVTDAPTIMAWLPGNRYVRDLTCTEREQYQVTPLCSS